MTFLRSGGVGILKIEDDFPGGVDALVGLRGQLAVGDALVIITPGEKCAAEVAGLVGAVAGAAMPGAAVDDDEGAGGCDHADLLGMWGHLILGLLFFGPKVGAGNEAGGAIFLGEIAENPEGISGREVAMIAMQNLVAFAGHGGAGRDGGETEIALHDVIHRGQGAGMENADVEERVFVDEGAEARGAGLGVEILSGILAFLRGDGLNAAGEGGGFLLGQHTGHDDVAVAIKAGFFLGGEGGVGDADFAKGGGHGGSGFVVNGEWFERGGG